MHKTYIKGLHGEKMALNFMQDKGYSLVKQRFKTTQGEIDLIMHKEEMIIFIEVKHRPTIHQALTALCERQMMRMIESAQLFLQQTDLEWQSVRFDLIAISGNEVIQHVENISFDYDSS